MKKYCTFFCSLLFLALLGLNVSCSREDSGDTPEPAPEPTPEITIPTGEDQVPVITDAGGEVTLKFTSATNWTLTINAGWVKTQVSTGKGGDQIVMLTILPNETTDERQAIVTVQSGNVKRAITITQKQKDALTLTMREQEMDATGGSFSIEVKSNIEFEVRISDETWIHRIENRALDTHTLSFLVDINESMEERVGEIVISGNGLKETFTISQEGEVSDEPEEPVLDVSEKNFSLKAGGGLIAFDVESNLEYDIEVGDGWISQDAAKSTDKHLVFMVEENTSTEERATTIKLTGGEQTCTVNVKQEGRADEQPDDNPILNVSRTDFSVKSEGETISFSVESNVEYHVTVQDDWVKQITSKALSTDDLSFIVDANTSSEPRQTAVTISGGGLTRTVIITQKGKVEEEPDGPTTGGTEDFKEEQENW